MITFLSHRGFWINEIEKNQEVAFERSWKNGLGLETDIRDFNRELVISHDIPENNIFKIDDFFKLYIRIGLNTPIALNIKSDGLAYLIKKKLIMYNIENYFVFDMSIPDTLAYLKYNMCVFSRQSEFEQYPAFYSSISGVWLDSFDTKWFSKELILSHLDNGKKVAIVSPELHKRDYFSFWNWLKFNKLHLVENILLCTDFPLKAQSYFYES